MENEEQNTTEEKPSFIEEAKSTAERLEAANKETARLLKEMQELEASRILGGKSAGREQVKTPTEIDPITYSQMVLAGKIPPKQ